MRVAIIFNHPYDQSFCSAILKSVQKGLEKANHEIDLFHLDRDGFNPVMTAADLKAFRDHKPIDRKVIEYKERLEKADHLIFIFPIWWELMPAMTKGFIDKVIFPGIAYTYTNGGYSMAPRLKKVKSVTIITTMNTPKVLYRLLFGNAIKKALITGTFWKMGYKKTKWISLNRVKAVSENKRKNWLERLENRFAQLN
ncbi:NAD(P)H-dependent oxidoreductase [Marinilongibacter aquaticus]|uniref:NAD(P)H-dependent oxidoreductase n=1 Tax=Marinilongibacter aquaticus TaxID=2975157 RepID=UPI0021BD8DD9|nr:NAD(P)H-dependent oxidoreductase [Marinilongibacter aquaticus]UBM59629.1 NAD(P)H-dependent oxidoreductase [Marinilongibacter aquaticus]